MLLKLHVDLALFLNFRLLTRIDDSRLYCLGCALALLIVVSFVHLLLHSFQLLENRVELSILLLPPQTIRLTAQVLLRTGMSLEMRDLFRLETKTAVETLKAFFCFDEMDSLPLETF